MKINATDLFVYTVYVVIGNAIIDALDELRKRASTYKEKTCTNQNAEFSEVLEPCRQWTGYTDGSLQVLSSSIYFLRINRKIFSFFLLEAG